MALVSLRSTLTNLALLGRFGGYTVANFRPNLEQGLLQNNKMTEKEEKKFTIEALRTPMDLRKPGCVSEDVRSR